MQHQTSPIKETLDMLMGQAGTLNQEEKEYTFTTPLEHGLSCKQVNSSHANFKKIVAQCWDYIDSGVSRGGSKEFISTEYIVQKVLSGDSDLWVSVDAEGNTVGCFVIGAAPYPEKTGIFAETIGGKFDFKYMTPVVEKFYKKCGYEFFEMTGRKGWERVMKPLGYKLMNITMYKRFSDE